MKAFVALLFLTNICQAQQWTTIVRKADKDMYYGSCQIIGDTVVYNLTYKTNSSGVSVGLREDCYIVKCDAGNPPPYSDQIIRWLLCDGFPSQYKEWKVEYEKGWSIEGDNPVWLSSVSFICPNHKSLLAKYTYNIVWKLDGIKVTQNKDTTNKYMKPLYEELEKKWGNKK